MPNTYFQFKQFKVHQEKCAIKVCTDTCVFGAWIIDNIENEKSKMKNVLDIGTGTGLLSLMLAQKLNSKFDAVEIDEQAALQAKENFEESLWSKRLFVFNTPIQQYISANSYDLIISNPPFFNQSLKSDNNQKNLAKHSCSLSFIELIDVVLKFLKPEGRFAILLPFTEFKRFEIIAKEKQLYLLQKADIQQTPSHSFFRTTGVFSKQILSQPINEAINIKDDSNQYTPRFINLLKDYYLHL